MFNNSDGVPYGLVSDGLSEHDWRLLVRVLVQRHRNAEKAPFDWELVGIPSSC